VVEEEAMEILSPSAPCGRRWFGSGFNVGVLYLIFVLFLSFVFLFPSGLPLLSWVSCQYTCLLEFWYALFDWVGCDY